MKVIVAGSRKLDALGSTRLINLVDEAINLSGFKITEIVSGGCYGVDVAGERWAGKKKIPIKIFLPDWNRYGRAAGPFRNKDMAEYAEASIVLCYDNSKGSINMISNMNKINKPCLEIYLDESLGLERAKIRKTNCN